MGLYSVGQAYSLSTWYENQCAFDLNVGTDLMLDLSRQILDSDSYVYQGVAFPTGTDINLAQQQTFSGTMNLIPYSYLISMSAWSGNGNQFTLRIFDKGSQSDIYYGQFAWYPTAISNMTGTFNNGQPIVQRDRNKPFGPYFFRSPLIIVPPGTLQVQVTNVENPDTPPNLQGLNQIQMLFGIAVPKTTKPLQNRYVGSSTDQTGLQSPSGIAPLQSIMSLISGGGG